MRGGGVSAGDLRLIAVFLLLAFLFSGDPDVWDVIHNKAMQMEACK